MGMVSTPSNSALGRLALFLFFSAIAVNASAGDWRITPSISVSERYTDNIALSAGTLSESAFVTDVSPRITVQRQGARARVEADYTLHGLLYSHDGDANTLQHQLSARLRAEPVSEVFFLDADARIDQSTVSTVDRIGGDYALGGNRVETRGLSITPILRKRFGNLATAEARWALSLTNSDGGVLSTSRGDTLSLSLASGRAFNRMPWSLSLSRRNIDSGGTDSEIGGINGYLGYRLSPKLELGFNVGQDDHSGNNSFNQLGGTYGNLALRWAPTTRTSLGASAGRRYDGDSYSLDFAHRTVRTTWALRYAETITDPGDLLLSFDRYLCLTGANQIQERLVYAGTPAPNGCVLIDRADISAQLLGLVAAPTLNKSWAGTVSYRLGKSTFNLSLSSNQRRTLSAAGGSEDIRNLNAAWNWRLGPRTSSTLSLSLGATESSTVATDSDYTTLSWILTRKLAAQTTGSLEIGHLEKTGGTSGDYDENTVAARLTHIF